MPRATPRRWPARSSDLDHEPAWADGGQTKPDGMLALHRRHHNAKTLHRHRIEQSDDGTRIWVTLTGHRYKIDPEVLDTTRLLDDNAGDPDEPGTREPPDDHEPPPF